MESPSLPLSPSPPLPFSFLPLTLHIPLLPLPAVGADAGDEHAVALDEELMFPGHRVADPLQLGAVELDQGVAHLAVEVIVAGVAVVVLVHATAAQRHLPQQARLDQLAQRAVDGGPADLALGDQFPQVVDELFGVEVIVVAEHLFDDHPPLLGDALAAGLQELRKALRRGQLNVHFPEGEAERHGHWLRRFRPAGSRRPDRACRAFRRCRWRIWARIEATRSWRTSGNWRTWSASRAASEMSTSSLMGAEAVGAAGCAARVECGALIDWAPCTWDGP